MRHVHLGLVSKCTCCIYILHTHLLHPAGYIGLTLDATAADGTATLVTFARYYSTADFGNGRLTTGFRTNVASGEHYLYVHANS